MQSPLVPSEVLFDRLPLAGLVVDQNGIIQMWNAAAQTLFGWTANEAIGSHQRILFPTQHHGTVDGTGEGTRVGDHEGPSISETATKDGRLIGCEWWNTVLRRESGEVFAYLSLGQEITGRRQRDESLLPLVPNAARLDDAIVTTTPEGLAGIGRDITNPKGALERSRFQDHLLEVVEQAVIATDRDGTILYWNQIAQSLYGRSATEVIGRSVREIIRAATSRDEMAAIVLTRLSAGESWSEEFRVQRRDGTDLIVVVNTSPIRDDHGEIVGFVGISSDITERRQIEEALQVSEKLAATGRIAAKVAHEINNPLAGIKAAFALVKDAVLKDHPYYDYVGRIDNEIDRIAGIVRQMYDLYRPEPEPARKFHLEDVIRDVVALLEPSSRQHAVAILVELPQHPVIVSLPEGALRQVLFNLIENAVEASQPGDLVRISADVTLDDLRIFVMDQGSGISHATAERVFEPFFTTKGADHPGGMGLGLSISKSLVGAMGGSLELRSEPGVTIFQLNLPLPAD